MVGEEAGALIVCWDELELIVVPEDEEEVVAGVADGAALVSLGA
jgi:hypothetical protein